MPQTKKQIKDLTFDHKGAHVALCKYEQGFSANGKPKALIVKSLEPVVLQKIQQIKVTMELPDFLMRFFDLYYDDAWTLAKLLGYEADPSENVYDQWLTDKVKSFEVLKSLKDSKDIKKDFDALDDDSRLSVLEDQVMLEKTLLAYAKKPKKDLTKEGKDVPDKKELAADDLQKALDIKTDEAAKAAVEKAAVQADLQKALDVIKSFEVEKQVAITKSKTDKVEAIVKTEADKAIFVKAALALSDEDFITYTNSLQSVYKAVEDSVFFKEVGASGEVTKSAKDDTPAQKTASALNALLQKQYNTKGTK